MNFNDGTTNRDVNSTKTTVDASHEDGDTTDVVKTEQEKMDATAMESAKRSTNRIHQAEQEAPDSTLFTK